MLQPTIPADLRERITAAATALYEEADRERFPTVDAVRRYSRADMNAVSLVMKEWRQAQTTQVAPVAVAVPESIQQANASALAALWLSALDLGNQNLRNAQSGWEIERQELDDMRAELANSFELQAEECEALKKQLAAADEKTAVLNSEIVSLHDSIADSMAKEAAAAATAEQMGHRISSQQAELERLHTEAEATRNQHVAELQALKNEAHGLRDQLADAGKKYDVLAGRERVKIEEAATAKAESSRLAGEIARLEKVNEKLETSVAALQQETRDLGSKLGQATGSMETLREQVAGQNDVLKGFAGQAVKKTKN